MWGDTPNPCYPRGVKFWGAEIQPNAYDISSKYLRKK